MQLNVLTQTVSLPRREVSEHQVSVTSCELIDLLNDDYWNKEAPFLSLPQWHIRSHLPNFHSSVINFFSKMVLHEIPALLCHELSWLNPVHFFIKSKSPAALNWCNSPSWVLHREITVKDVQINTNKNISTTAAEKLITVSSLDSYKL